WLEKASAALAYAVVASAAVIDFQAAVIDGWLPLEIRRRLVEGVGNAIRHIDAEGLELPAIREGTVGIHARALGAASLPLSERFLVGSRSHSGSICCCPHDPLRPGGISQARCGR